MAQTRRKFTSAFKAKVVLEALKERHTLAELLKKCELSGALVSRWKRDFSEKASSIFDNVTGSEEQSAERTDCRYRSSSYHRYVRT